MNAHGAPRFPEAVEPYVRIDGKHELTVDWCATVPALYWQDVDVIVTVTVWSEDGDFYWWPKSVKSDPVRGGETEPVLDTRWPDSMEAQLFKVLEPIAFNALDAEVRSAAHEAGLLEGEAA